MALNIWPLPIPTVRFQPSIGATSQIKNIPSISYHVTRQNGSCCRSGGGLLTVPTPNTSSMSNKSMGQTDMSYVSEDASSGEVSRGGRSSTDDTGDEVDSYDRTVQNSLLIRTLKSPPSIILENDESTSQEENHCIL